MGAILGAAVVSGSIYALISLGFALAFRISGVFNLAHGILLVAAGYANYGLGTLLGIPPWLSIPASILLVSLIGFAIEGGGIPLAKRAGLKPVDIMVLSWLMLVVLQDVLIIIFSSTSIYMGSANVVPGWALLGARITPLQLFTVSASLAAGLGFFLMARFSVSGREITAVGDNPLLASICGVNVKRVVGLNAAAAALLTAGAGVLFSYQDRLDPTLGMRFSIVAIVATLAGIRLGPAGAVLGAFAFGLLESLVLYLVDPGLRDTAVYFCLLVVVLVTYRRRLLPETG
jgi:branched-chain amino acid transport system permease protein